MSGYCNIYRDGDNWSMRKNIFQQYVAYLKDNPEHYWFKRKLFGWGWTPATREGWAVTLIFVLLIVGNAIRFNPEVHSEEEVLTKLIPQTLALVLILIGICYLKGEKPEWRWGLPKKENGNDPFV